MLFLRTSLPGQQYPGNILPVGMNQRRWSPGLPLSFLPSRLRDVHLDFAPTQINNDRMVIPGRVRNGVVVLEGGMLPEGATVTVTYPAPAEEKQLKKKSIEVPLVRTGEPATVNLTGARIAEIMADEDASSRH